MAIAITLGTSLFICLRWRNLVVTGPTPLPLLAFSAILFTSGLDVGLIMFPLVEFPVVLYFGFSLFLDLVEYLIV